MSHKLISVLFVALAQSGFAQGNSNEPEQLISIARQVAEQSTSSEILAVDTEQENLDEDAYSRIFAGIQKRDETETSDDFWKTYEIIDAYWKCNMTLPNTYSLYWEQYPKYKCSYFEIIRAKQQS